MLQASLYMSINTIIVPVFSSYLMSWSNGINKFHHHSEEKDGTSAIFASKQHIIIIIVNTDHFTIHVRGWMSQRCWSTRQTSAHPPFQDVFDCHNLARVVVSFSLTSLLWLDLWCLVLHLERFTVATVGWYAIGQCTSQFVSFLQ